MIKRILAKTFFNLVSPFFKLVLFIFTDLKVESEEDLKNVKPPLLIVVNHTSWLDPFLAGAIFPFNSRVYPICYAAWKGYYYSILLPFMVLLGTFPVQAGIGIENTLREGVKILETDGTVGIFPEGKRRRLGRPRRGKRGAAYLAIKTGVPILTVKIDGLLGLSPGKFFTQRTKIRIRVKKIYNLPKEMKIPDDLNRATDIIMKKLRDF